MNIGIKIKQLRVLCQLTQEELADRCELTKGYISQIENDLTSPAISTLKDILAALGTNLKEFFNDSDDDEKIVFTDEDYIVKEEKYHKMTWLVPNSQKNAMEPILFTLTANSQTTIDMPHEGQEFGYVLEGEILIVLGGKNIVCNKGETFYFTTDKNHYLKNMTKKIAKIIWVTSPPNF